MLAPIVLAVFVAGAPVAQPAVAQQPPASSVQAPAENPWPPAGVYRRNEGVTIPRLIEGPNPKYTPDAMSAHIEGEVKLEAIVQADGTVGDIRVVRSLDKKFGLDDQAVAALKRWRFAPGRKDGAAVPVLVEVEMTFRMRK
jgi:periplasmic protein TonB